MHDSFRAIDPNGISINADGSVSFQNTQLRGAATQLSSGVVVPNSDNFGTCTNGGTCSGANMDCTNTGTCTGSNFGQCNTTGPGRQ